MGCIGAEGWELVREGLRFPGGSRELHRRSGQRPGGDAVAWARPGCPRTEGQMEPQGEGRKLLAWGQGLPWKGRKGAHTPHIP